MPEMLKSYLKGLNPVLLAVFFYFMLVLGRGCTLVASIDPRDNFFGLLVFCAACAVLVSNLKNPLFTRKFLIVISFTILWTGLHFAKDSDFQYFTYFQFFAYILAGYLIARVYGYSIVAYFENSVFILSAISLLFWTVELILGPHEFGTLAFIPQTYGKDGGSFLIYTVLDSDYEGNFFMGLARNCGFAWEPGRYASILVIALFFNRLLSPKKFFNLHSITMLVALLSTFSTTGYIALLLMWAIDLLLTRRTPVWFKAATFIILSIIVVAGSSLSFISPKIAGLMNRDAFVSENLANYGGDEIWTVDRFEGMLLDAYNFIHDPITGYGLAQQDQYIYESISDILNTSNGIVKPLAQYGILLGIPFFIFFYFGTVRICKAFRYKRPWLLFVVIMTVSVSYSFEQDPLIRAISLFSLFYCVPVRRRKRMMGDGNN